MHVRAQTGTRIEETTRLADRIGEAIRKIIPADELDGIVDNIGLSVSGINMAYNNSWTIGVEDADILVSLKPNHAPTADYVKTMREQLPRQFPGTSFAFLPADMVSQILNFGVPAPIDLQLIATICRRIGNTPTSCGPGSSRFPASLMRASSKPFSSRP